MLGVELRQGGELLGERRLDAGEQQAGEQHARRARSNADLAMPGFVEWMQAAAVAGHEVDEYAQRP